MPKHDVLVPIEQMTRDEIAAMQSQLRYEAYALLAHADEFDEYLKSRQSAANTKAKG